MKRLFLIVAAIFAVYFTASAQTITCKGKISIFRSPATYIVEFNYDNLHVEGKDLETYLMEEDEDPEDAAEYREEWFNEIVPDAESKGKKIPSKINKDWKMNAENPKYKVIIYVDDLYLGNAIMAYLPSPIIQLPRVGAATITGSIEAVEMATNNICTTITYKDIRGLQSGNYYKAKSRWGKAYKELGRTLKRIVKDH